MESVKSKSSYKINMASRIIQVMQYGWKHSAQIAGQHKENKIKRFIIFVDIMSCFHKYRMWSNQYLKEDFYYKESSERHEIGKKYLELGLVRDEWQARFQADKKYMQNTELRNMKSGINEEKKEHKFIRNSIMQGKVFVWKMMYNSASSIT